MSPQQTIAHYRITAKLGEGGMGAVYRATDTKLSRDVAIKILSGAFAMDPDRMARFTREAQVLASLNHPNIATIHGVEERALVMELVEGPTLVERIALGPIPLEEALPIAKQIAEALEHAHERGIVHRDLKPANIKVTPEGRVKVLDFGLAKAMAPETTAADPANSPTVTMHATQTGVILGTAAYMAPEQARGKGVDKRADIWAFGVVLYEMVAGRRLFRGETVSDILAAVLTTEPDWSRVPAAVEPLLRRCLVRDPQQRLRDIGDAWFVSQESSRMPPAKEKRWLADKPWLIPLASAAILVAVLAVVYFGRTPAPEIPELRSEINIPPTNDPRSFALSPDGRQLTYVATADGQSWLWVRPLASTKAQPLVVIEGGATYPFWSPDSRSIGFFSDSKLRRIEATGGPPQTVADAKSGRGGTWNADDVILFSPTPASPVVRVPASGGEAVTVTHLDWSGSQRFAQFLPDGVHFLFYAEGTPEHPGQVEGAIYLGSLNSKDVKRLTDANSSGLYLPPGWLLFVHAGTLVAQRLNIATGELSGLRVTAAESVFFDSSHARMFSVSATGLVAYRRGAPVTQLGWFDRSGQPLGTLATPVEHDGGTFSHPSISPDGRRVAVNRDTQEGADIWLLDETHANRVTFDGGRNGNTVWSPDGSKIGYRGIRNGKGRFYVKPSDGTGREAPMVDLELQDNMLNDWSPDGRFLLYQNQNANSATGYDLVMVPLDKERKPWAFLQTKFDEKQGRFSPDGRWVAYQSNQSGRPEVYIRPFADPASGVRTDTSSPQWQVSVAGGLFPAWSHDGKELYWVGPDSRTMAATITVTGKTLQPSIPVALFQTRIYGGGLDVNTGGWQFEVSPDGRFLINTVLESETTPITLVQNWQPK
jgi:eukaryotic-like serine/threonine-protein kinase